MCPSSLQVDTIACVHIASMTSNYTSVQTATAGRLRLVPWELCGEIYYEPKIREVQSNNQQQELVFRLHESRISLGHCGATEPPRFLHRVTVVTSPLHSRLGQVLKRPKMKHTTPTTRK